MEKLTEEKIIRYLQINDLASSIQLATYFSVSTRTIKNYIKKINDAADNKVILSSSKGYTLKDKAFKTSHSKKGSREKQLIDRLIYALNPVNKYDLADELFISLSTVDRTIHKANQLLLLHDLSISAKGNELAVQGSEEQKRAWIREQFYSETNADFLHLAAIQATFYGYDLESLKEVITQILKEHNLYINGYTLNSIILHLVIAMERINDSNQILSSPDDAKLTPERASALKIASYIEQTYHLMLSDSEISYMTVLLKSKTTLLNYSEIKNDFKEYLTDESIHLTNALLKKINTAFFLSLDDEDFFIKFSLHIQNLLNRNRVNQVALNPMTKEIKESYPLVYDLAVFVSNELEEYLQTEIVEDEITYLAFHIGAYFEQSKINQSKLSATLICPSYYDMHIDLSQKILTTFEDRLDFKKVITEIDAPIVESDQQLIISTIILPEEITYIKITPFFNERDQEAVNQMIKKMNRKQQQEKLKKMIEQYFSKELFEKNQTFHHKNDIIHSMCQKLVSLQRVKPSFEEEILKREKMSSTSFSNGLAMPHSMEMNALKTSLYFMMSETPLPWDDGYVNIVVMMAMNKSERKEFRKIFNLIVQSLSEKTTIDLLLKTASYEEFISTLVDSFEL